MNKRTMRNIRRVTLIIFGSFIMSVGTYFFLFQAQIASGGVGGTAFIINHVFPQFDIGYITALLNAVLFIIGFILLGREFGIYTIAGTAAYSLFFILYDYLFPNQVQIVSDPLINLIIGAGLTGVGLAFVFNQNASTGGTDIIAKIVDKYLHTGMGTAVMLADSFVIILAAFTLGVEKAIYGILALVFTSFILDKYLKGFNTLIQMTIISEKIEEINLFINVDLERGTTLYKALGGYTKAEKEILMTIVERAQYLKIKQKVEKIDPDAFVFVSSTTEVIGEGFTKEVTNND